jgi:hypothetical protein
MQMQQIIETVRDFEGSLVVTPEPGSNVPEIAWGDAFFYYAPDGVMPERTQPYGTIITKDYPGDVSSHLDGVGRFRVNIHVGREKAERVTDAAVGPAETDRLFPHPLYGPAGWVSVVNPADHTAAVVLALLRDAHEAARARSRRRGTSE